MTNAKHFGQPCVDDDHVDPHDPGREATLEKLEKSSPAEDLVNRVALPPWWAGAALVLLSDVLLHQLAAQALIVTAQPGQLGSMNTQALGNRWRALMRPALPNQARMRRRRSSSICAPNRGYAEPRGAAPMRAQSSGVAPAARPAAVHGRSVEARTLNGAA